MIALINTKYVKDLVDEIPVHELTVVIFNLKCKILIFTLSQELHLEHRNLSPPLSYGPTSTSLRLQ
jgi:hypothetical protein